MPLVDRLLDLPQGGGGADQMEREAWHRLPELAVEVVGRASPTGGDDRASGSEGVGTAREVLGDHDAHGTRLHR